MTLCKVVILAVALVAAPALAESEATAFVDGGIVAGEPAGASGITVFKGIPFAAPPVDDLRWRAPQPVAKWDGIRAATEFGPDCPQISAKPRPQSEDCLYLNVWTGAHAADEKRPVMIWIYGGGYRAGSSAMPHYDGEALARRGVVFVSIAYRVGPLGFMAHPELSAESQRRVSGNYGLLDQIAALDWVRRNIAAFGGDPDRITIFGQSAGSISTSYLASSPLATGKFHGLIAQTGGGFGMLAPASLAEAEQKGLEFGRSLGAPTLAEMREIDAARLVDAAGTVSGVFQPIRDGWVVPADLQEIYRAGLQNDVPMIVGSNRDESGEDRSLDLRTYRQSLREAYGEFADELFALHPASTDQEARNAARDLGTLVLGDYTMFTWASEQVKSGRSPVYAYRFVHAPPIPRAEYPGGPDAAPPGAWHGAEIRYVMGNLSTTDWPWAEEDQKLSDTLTSYWVNFASTGNPNAPGLPQWPTMQERPELLMELGVEPRPIERPGRPTLEVLRKHFEK